MVFWWTGRGFLSLLFLIGVFGLFGALATFALGSDIFERLPWLWGVGLILAAIANWVGGGRLNRVPLHPFKYKLRDRMTYRARNRFMSLPMELWSGPVLIAGVFVIARNLV